MTREEARYYLQSSGFSEEQMNTIEQAFKPKPTDNATLRDIFCMGCEYKEQEPCEMTVEEYRQRMIQAFHNADTDELIAVCVLPTEKEFEHLEWLLKNHYKKESCDDAISKQVVLDIVDGYSVSQSNVEDVTQDIISDIMVLPPVTPQPKTGHWVGEDGKPIHLKDGMTTKSAWCSECGKWLTASDEYSCFGNFCPSCGAKMSER